MVISGGNHVLVTEMYPPRAHRGGWFVQEGLSRAWEVIALSRRSLAPAMTENWRMAWSKSSSIQRRRGHIESGTSDHQEEGAAR